PMSPAMNMLERSLRPRPDADQGVLCNGRGGPVCPVCHFRDGYEPVRHVPGTVANSLQRPKSLSHKQLGLGQWASSPLRHSLGCPHLSPPDPPAADDPLPATLPLSLGAHPSAARCAPTRSAPSASCVAWWPTLLLVGQNLHRLGAGDVARDE